MSDPSRTGPGHTPPATDSVSDSVLHFLRKAGAEHGLGDEEQHSLEQPYRELSCELRVRCKSGSTRSFRGYRVQHDRSRGPFKGGMRYHPQLDLGHTRALARLMTVKTALTDLPLGGAKGGIDCDPSQLELSELEQLTKQFIERLHPVIGPNQDVLAPDMGTGEREMAWMFEEYAKLAGDQPGVATGKPLALGGSPFRRESTGFGVARVALWAAKEADLELRGTTVAIQGFGNVGLSVARYLSEAGLRIVAVSGRDGGVYAERGLDVEALARTKREHHFDGTSLGEGQAITNGELLALDVDVLVPAAIEGVITQENAARVRAKIVAEGANLPVTAAADAALAERGVIVVPDILANAGGVVCSYFEWVQNHQRFRWKLEKVRARVEATLEEAWKIVRARAQSRGESYRDAAYAIAVGRVIEASRLRGM